MLTQRLKRNRIVIAALALLLSVQTVQAQTTAFTYQGRLTDTGTPQSTYQMRFELYDALTGPNQVGATITNPSVAVTQGSFTVQLDFGAAAFDGTNRFLEIAVKRNAGDPFTILIPRQQIASSPYSIRALGAAQADVALDANKLGGLDASEYVTTTGAGNTFVSNATTQQTGNFNISGVGIVGNSLGIGTTPNPGFKLDMIGNARITTANGAEITFASPNAESGMSTAFNGGRADLRFDGTTLKLVAGLAGGPPSPINGINIDTDGNVGIGTTNLANARLQVDGFARDGIYGFSSFGNGVDGQGTSSGVRGFCGSIGGRGVYGISINGVGVEGSGNGSNSFGVFSNGYLGVDRLGAAGNTTMCRNSLNQIANCSSSLRYKKDLQPFGDGLSFINQLQPIAFKWKTDNLLDVGFAAEDVAKINPLFVTYNDKGEVEGVKYDRLSVVFVNAFKQQQTQIERQQKQLEEQQLQIENLKKLICLDHPSADVCRQK
jgi:hypothetical protein